MDDKSFFKLVSSQSTKMQPVAGRSRYLVFHQNSELRRRTADQTTGDSLTFDSASVTNKTDMTPFSFANRPCRRREETGHAPRVPLLKWSTNRDMMILFLEDTSSANYVAIIHLFFVPIYQPLNWNAFDCNAFCYGCHFLMRGAVVRKSISHLVKAVLRSRCGIAVAAAGGSAPSVKVKHFVTR